MDSTIIAAIIGAIATILGVWITYFLTSRQEEKKRKNELKDLSQRKDIELTNLKDVNELELKKIKEEHKNEIEKMEMKNKHDLEIMLVQFQAEIDKSGKVKEQDLITTFAGEYISDIMQDKNSPFMQEINKQVQRQFLSNK